MLPDGRSSLYVHAASLQPLILRKHILCVVSSEIVDSPHVLTKVMRYSVEDCLFWIGLYKQKKILSKLFLSPSDDEKRRCHVVSLSPVHTSNNVEATLAKQRSTLSKGRDFNAKLVRHCCRFWQQSRTLLRHCCWCGPGFTAAKRQCSCQCHVVGPIIICSRYSLRSPGTIHNSLALLSNLFEIVGAFSLIWRIPQSNYSISI